MELPKDIASCHRIILELASFIDGIKPQLQGYVQKVEQLESRVKELESQLHQNSRNSNYPSSMDKYKPKPAFPRIKGGKIGGKKGHDGGTLKMVSAPDVVKTYTPEVCTRCGQIHGTEPMMVRARRQVFDIPPHGSDRTSGVRLDLQWLPSP